MVSEEPAHLVGAPKTCTLCKLAGMHTFLYNNNNNPLQPRYECLGCGHQFTHGGVAYKKKNRKKFRARASPSSRPPPPRPPSTSPPSPPSSPHSPLASLAQSSPSALALEPAAPPIRPRSPSASADYERAGARMARNAARLPVEVEAAGPWNAQVVTGVRVTRASLSPPPGSPSAHPGTPSSLGLEPAAAAPRPRHPYAADRERARARMATDAAKLPVEVEAAGPSDAQVVTGVRLTRASPSPHPASSSTPPASPIRPRFPSAADREIARARMARDAAMLPVQIEGAGPSGAEVVTGVRVTRAAGGVMPELPSKLMYQVRIKVSGADDVVRCVLMDLESGIPEGF